MRELTKARRWRYVMDGACGFLGYPVGKRIGMPKT
jgi:hypothetical protein